MKKGDIILINFPFTDMSGSKLRPALVLAEKREDILTAFITSSVEDSHDDDLLLKADKDNKLKQDSRLRLFKLATLKKSFAVGKLGFLNKSTLHDIDLVLLRILSINL